MLLRRWSWGTRPGDGAGSSRPPEVLAALVRGEPVDPTLYSMRTQPRFETGDPRYAWLNRMIAVGIGVREPAAVRISVFEVL